jgi:hypothetical protein
MRISFGLLLAFGWTVASYGAASAAPQALLVVAQDDAVEFQCDRVRCVAEVSTLCLQQDRPSPEPGTAYRLLRGKGAPADAGLIGRTRSGAVVPLSNDALNIRAARDHRAVRLEVPSSLLARKGLSSLTLLLTDLAVLAPVAADGDTRPQRKADLDVALGAQRTVARRVIARHAEEAGATAILRDMLNTLPRDRAVSETERSAVYSAVVASRRARAGGAVPADVLDTARTAVRICDFVPNRDAMFRGLHGDVSHYRSCLNQQHDRLIMNINQRYWQDFEAGS